MSLNRVCDRCGYEEPCEFYEEEHYGAVWGTLERQSPYVPRYDLCHDCYEQVASSIREYKNKEER